MDTRYLAEEMSQLLFLSRDEIIVLTDRIQNTDAGTDDMRVRSYDLLLKLSSAYLELVTVDGINRPEVPIAITEAEAWALRTKVTSMDKTPNDALFGVKLLRKIYTILQAYNAVLDVPLAEGVEEKDARAIKDALARWREREDG